MKFSKNWKRFWNLSRRSEGFTLVELIVVIAILAILAGVATAGYSGYIKKANEAADLDTLYAINTAFAAACIENNTDATLIKTAAIQFSGGVLTQINGVDTSAANNPYNVSFDKFFGTGDIVFKTYEALYFVNGAFAPVPDVYVAAYNNIMANYTSQINSVTGSAFGAIGATSLLNQVDSVAGLANTLIAGGSTLSNVVMTPAYLETLANTMDMTTDDLDTYMNTLSDEEYFNFLANSTVLNVANTMSGMDATTETETLTMLQNANFGGLGNTLNTDPEKGLAQAALLYGMYTAYKPEDAQALDSVDDLTNLMNDEEFKAYLSEVNTEGSQAQKDYQGYKSALEIVNGAVSDSPETAEEILNGSYSDPELVGIISSIIGG